ncbi:unnamed protein product [Trichobilharzia regenti]|nr:unnamed protein product [Trichobilharzia regenti]
MIKSGHTDVLVDPQKFESGKEFLHSLKHNNKPCSERIRSFPFFLAQTLINLLNGLTNGIQSFAEEDLILKTSKVCCNANASSSVTADAPDFAIGATHQKFSGNR